MNEVGANSISHLVASSDKPIGYAASFASLHAGLKLMDTCVAGQAEGWGQRAAYADKKDGSGSALSVRSTRSLLQLHTF